MAKVNCDPMLDNVAWWLGLVNVKSVQHLSLAAAEVGHIEPTTMYKEGGDSDMKCMISIIQYKEICICDIHHQVVAGFVNMEQIGHSPNIH